MFLLVAFDGNTVAFKLAELPILSVFVDGLTVIDVTNTFPVTVTVQQSQAPLPSAAVAVIIAVI